MPTGASPSCAKSRASSNCTGITILPSGAIYPNFPRNSYASRSVIPATFPSRHRHRHPRGRARWKIAAIVVTEAADIAQRIGEREFPFGGRAGAGHTDPVTDTAQALPLQRHDHTPRAVNQAVEHPAIPGFPPDHGMAVAEIRGIVVGRRHHHLPEGIGIPVFPLDFIRESGIRYPPLLTLMSPSAAGHTTSYFASSRRATSGLCATACPVKPPRPAKSLRT